MFYSYKGVKPIVHKSAYVHPQAVVTGQVVIGANVYIGPCAAIRGGFGKIIHGAEIGANCLIGMNAVIMDNVVIGDECIVGALSFVKAKSIYENRSLIVGHPAKKIKDVSDEMIGWKRQGTAIYQQLANEGYEAIKECQPFYKYVDQELVENKDYRTWDKTKDDE